MIAKSLLAGALALVLSPSEQAATLNPTTFVSDPYVVKISCTKGSGSGFRLKGGQWVSAHHVTSLGGCEINGLPIVVTYSDPLKDYSLFTLPGDELRGGLEPDCSGFHDLEWYYGEGAARGNPILTAVPVMASRIISAANQNLRGWEVLLYNRFIPGQSGGAVRSAITGKVAGVVNAYGIEFPVSLSIPLSRTILCQNSASAAP